MYKRQGFDCTEAENGDQALAIILQQNYHLVIADSNMPVRGGLEFLEDIRGEENLRKVPVIITMIEPLEELIDRGNLLGMSAHLTKPFDVFTLSKILDKVILNEVGESL